MNTIVKNKTGEVSSCDILYTDDLDTFNREYLEHTVRVSHSCEDRDLSETCMVIGTSAIVDTELDGAQARRFLENLQNEIDSLK